MKLKLLLEATSIEEETNIVDAINARNYKSALKAVLKEIYNLPAVLSNPTLVEEFKEDCTKILEFYDLNLS